MRNSVLVLAPLLLCGCQTWGPTWSEISGERTNHAILYRRPGIIDQIDGNSPFPRDPIRVEPGRRVLVVDGRAPGWPGPNLVNFTLDALPCKRYYINAQFENPIEPRFRPVIDYIEDIPGCRSDVAVK